MFKTDLLLSFHIIIIIIIWFGHWLDNPTELCKYNKINFAKPFQLAKAFLGR